MKLKPLGKSFIFQFFSDTYGIGFVEKNKGQIILTNQNLDEQGKFARWGRVVSIGPEVSSLKVNDIVLIEALQWTTQMPFEGSKYWKSDEDKVLAVGEDESVTYAY